MGILLVEDDQKIAALLSRGLTEQGFEVRVATDGQAGLDAVKECHPDLVILDVMMPGRDGWSVLSEIRRSPESCPVLMLTARDAIEDRVRGLELGADDYLIKPFAFPELVARIKNVLRRGAAAANASGAAAPDLSVGELVVGELRINQLDRKVSRAGKPIELTAREFQLLVYLAKRAGEVVSRSEIARQVWDLRFEGASNVVEVHIRRLRMKLDEGFDAKLIRTLRGMGYQLNKGDEIN